MSGEEETNRLVAELRGTVSYPTIAAATTPGEAKSA
jgi:hypothetical protein